MFRSRCWPRGRCSACQLHHSISVSTIHAGLPDLVPLLSPQEPSTEQQFKFTLVRPLFLSPWYALPAQHKSGLWPKGPEPKGTWNTLVQQSFAHILQLEWNTAGHLLILHSFDSQEHFSHQKTCTRCNEKHSKRKQASSFQEKKWEDWENNFQAGKIIVMCELCLKIGFKICCLEGSQQQAVQPGNRRWCYFTEHDCRMLHHRL